MGVLGFVARSDWRYLVAHAQEAGDRGLDLGGPGLGLGVPGVGHGRVPDAGNYYMAAAERGEPAGRWFGPGVGLLGYAEGQAVSARAMEAVYGRLVNPRTGEMLGSRPRRYPGFEERLGKLEAAERAAVGGPLTAERCEELRFAARKDQREACHYYDLTYSPEKSWSVLYAGLKAAGLDAEAEVLWSCLEDGYKTGLTEAMEQACYARTGTHSGRVGDRSFGRWEASGEWVSTLWRHHTSRAGDPQLHIHGALLNRVRVATEDGPAWYALDGTAVKNVRRAAASTMSRVSEALAAERLGLTFVARADGKGREIVGVDERLIEAFSSRRRTIEKEAADLAAAYREEYRREPTAYELRLFSEQATLATRDRKPEHAPTGPELLAVWEAKVRDGLGTDLADVPGAASLRPLDTPAAVRVLEVDPGLDGAAWLAQVLPDAGARELVIDQALADVGGRLSTWTRADVKAALDAHLPTATLTELPATVQGRLLDELADLALAHPDATRLSVDPLLDAPAVWRRPGDGRGLHEPPAAYDRYTHATVLGREAALVEAALVRGFPGLAEDAIAARLAATTLRPSQRAAVQRVLTSERQVDVLIGPAGTGKSYTLGELARLWTEHIPGPADGTAPRVLGLATSEAAVRVLHEDGITRHLNVDTFLMLHTLDQAGVSLNAVDADLVRLRSGDLLILDEASMTSTEDVAQVLAATRAAGAKLVLAGDDRQLGAVEAGGAFGLLAERTRPVVLDEVVRFANAWEGPASLRLRAGDASAIREYDRRGRILAGTSEELLAAARRAFVADHLTGRATLVITATNEAAAEVASHIRAELVTLGRVEPAGIRLHNDTRAGVGDLIATRHNDRSLDDGCGGWVANRDTWTVTARHDDGSLSVRRDLGPDDTGVRHWGPEVVLPATYVGEHVELAYAATVHAAQGRTVDTCYPIIEPSMGADALYVALTRAKERTLIGVAIEREPIDALGPQDTERPQTTPEAVLAQIIERPHEPASATQVLAAHVDARESLARLGPEWTDLITRDAHARYTTRLAELLGEERSAELRQDPAFGPLLRAVRAAEIAGRDAEELLTRAVTRRELGSAESLAQVLHYRITADTPRQDTGLDAGRAAGGLFRSRTPDLTDPALDGYAKAIAAAMDERVEVLGERVAADPPGWAIAALGPVPDEAASRLDWTRRAGIIAGYREQHGWVHEREPIGPAPHRSAAEDRADWHAAWTALGRPDEARDLAATSRGELANTVQAWERAQAAAPPNVDEQLRAAARTADFCDREARYLHAQATAGAPGASGQSPAELAAHAAEFRRYETAARAQLATLEEAAARRTAWYEGSAELRRGAQLAAAELDRRAGRPDTPAVAERERVPVGGVAEVDREAGLVRAREVLGRLQATWAQHARAAAELERAGAALEQVRAAAAELAAERAALAPFREQREAAREAAALAQAAAESAQARLDTYAAQVRGQLQERWEQNKAAIAEAGRVVAAGTGRLGWGQRGVRAAEQELHQWARAWSPLVDYLNTEDTRNLAYYAQRHPANDATYAPFDAHAKTQAAREMAEDLERVQAAEAARQAAAEALRRYGEQAARLRQGARPHHYSGTPESVARWEQAHTHAEARTQRLTARLEQLAGDPALDTLPERENALTRAQNLGTRDYHAELHAELAAAERAAAEREISYDYDLHHDRGIGYDGPSLGI